MRVVTNIFSLEKPLLVHYLVLRSKFYEVFSEVMNNVKFRPTSIGVYGRISYFRTWIESKMTSPTFCSSGPNADTTNRRRKNKNKQKRRKNKRKNAQRKKNSGK